MKTPIFRDATSVDVAALARLHMTTFNETHSPMLMNGPTYEVRADQWRQAFESADGSWFCVVIEDPNGELIGFAKGQPYSHHDHPEFTGGASRPCCSSGTLKTPPTYSMRPWERRGYLRPAASFTAATAGGTCVGSC